MPRLGDTIANLREYITRGGTRRWRWDIPGHGGEINLEGGDKKPTRHPWSALPRWLIIWGFVVAVLILTSPWLRIAYNYWRR